MNSFVSYSTGGCTVLKASCACKQKIPDMYMPFALNINSQDD